MVVQWSYGKVSVALTNVLKMIRNKMHQFYIDS